MGMLDGIHDLRKKRGQIKVYFYGRGKKGLCLDFYVCEFVMDREQIVPFKSG